MIPRVVWLIALLAIVMRVGIALATHFTSEDFLITLRYVENLAHGRGFVYNVGERVLGTTTPLYTLFLAMIARLGLPATEIGKGVNILADGALCLLMYRWLREVGQETAGRVAAFWVAVSPLHLRWAISGMETSLVTLCGVWVWLAYAQRRYRVAYCALAVLFLLRWDSVLLLGALTLGLVWRERRIPWRELGLYALLIAPWLLFAAWYFGSPIPVTGAAKMAVYGWRAHGVLAPQLAHLGFRLYGTPLYALITLCALLGLARVWRERWTLFAPPLLWFGLYWLAFLLSKVLLFEWYLVPPLPVYGLLVALGLVPLLERVGESSLPRPLKHAAAWSVALLIALTMTWTMYRVSRETQLIEDNLRIPLGLWLKANSRPTDRILLEPIGFIGYYSERPILDVIGLVSPAVLPYWNSRSAYPMLDIAEAFRPEWCVFRPGELQHIHDAARLTGRSWEAEYELVRTVSYTPRANRERITFHVFHRKTIP